MSFRITGLDPAPFAHLFGLPDEALAAHGAVRYVAQSGSALPDRVEVRDLAPGESALLVNYTHQPADTPYRASHAIFVREGAEKPVDVVGDIPQAMRTRPLSLRAFDADHMIVDGDLVDGREAESLIARFLANPQVAYIQAHYAKRGCYAARIERV